MVERVQMRTERGDVLAVVMFDDPGRPPSVLLTVVDADDNVFPTAEFTLAETAELRELLRKMCEKAVRPPR